MTDPCRIFVADDHEIVREGIRALIKANLPDCTIVGEAADGESAVRAVRDTTPDVVVIDITMPRLNGIEAARTILRMLPDCKIIVLSMHGSQEYVSQMLKVGVSAYLQKTESFAELAAAIEAVRRGEVYLGRGVAAVLVDDYKRLSTGPSGEPAEALSPRERHVLQLLAEGRRPKDIAQQLSVSVKTVETHRSNIMRKLDLPSIAELTKYAIRKGITTLDH